jgi:general secretion pathway protein L
MAAQLLSLPLGPWRTSLFDLSRRLGRWWLTEFLNLFPDQVAPWLVGRDRKVLLLAAEQDRVRLQLLSDGRQPLASQHVGCANYSVASIDHFLSSHGLARKDVAIGIRLPSEHFFSRRLLLPLEAARSLDEVVLQDLTRRTPFRLADIYHDCTTSKAEEADRVVVWQWVIRRETVAAAIASLAIDLESVAFIDAGGESGGRSPAPLIALRWSSGSQGSLVRRTATALAVGTLLLAVAAGGLTYWRQQSAMDDLVSQIAAVRQKAQQVRAAIDKLDQKQAGLIHLRSQKRETPSLLQVWEEATRILPAHSWLTELRLSEGADKQTQQVAMTGFSAAAASLVGLVDQSPMFGDTSLTAPIAMDPVEGRERFALQARTKHVKQPENKP